MYYTNHTMQQQQKQHCRPYITRALSPYRHRRQADGLVKYNMHINIYYAWYKYLRRFVATSLRLILFTRYSSLHIIHYIHAHNNNNITIYYMPTSVYSIHIYINIRTYPNCIKLSYNSNSLSPSCSLSLSYHAGDSSPRRMLLPLCTGAYHVSMAHNI